MSYNYDPDYFLTEEHEYPAQVCMACESIYSPTART
jgi:hypothetical protein